MMIILGGKMDMVAVEQKIKKVLKSRAKNYQKTESLKMLQQYGIIDKDQRVTPRYQNVIVKKTTING